MESFTGWSSFPIELQPRIQKLHAQLERAENEYQETEKDVDEAVKKMSSLGQLLDQLKKSLMPFAKDTELPEFMMDSAVGLQASINTWLKEQFTEIEECLKEQQETLQEQAYTMENLEKIGFEGIASYRQEFGSLTQKLNQAKQELVKLENRAREAGLLENQWESILAAAREKVDRLEKWSNFPIDLKDDIVQRWNQYSQMRSNIAGKRGQIIETEQKLENYQAQIKALEHKILRLESVRDILPNDQARIQALVFKTDASKQVISQLQKRIKELEDNEDHLLLKDEKERKFVELLEKSGIGGLITLQQRWVTASKRSFSMQPRFQKAKNAWTNVGMKKSEFLEFEKTVDNIKKGSHETPKTRKGCRSIFPFIKKQVDNIDSTPTEVKIFTDIQPIYTEYVYQQSEIESAEKDLRAIETEIRQELGPLAPIDICEDALQNLIDQLQKFQEKINERKQEQAVLSSFQAQLLEEVDRVNDLEGQLFQELNKYGISNPNITEALTQYNIACEQKAELMEVERGLGSLKAQASIVEDRVEQFHEQQRDVEHMESEIANLLSTTGTQIKGASLTDNFNSFLEGIEGYNAWRDANWHYEITSGTN